MNAICHHCKKQFRAINLLLKHLRQKTCHDVTSKGEYECAQDGCSKGYSDSRSFSRHLNQTHHIPHKIDYYYESSDSSDNENQNEENDPVPKRMRLFEDINLTPDDQIAGPSGIRYSSFLFTISTNI